MFPTKYELNASGNDGMAEAAHDTEIRIACRCIMVGSYCYRPRNNVRISSDDVSIPTTRRPSQSESTIQIPLKSIVHVLAHTDNPPAIILYTEAKVGERVRETLGMQRETGPYFDPLSPDESIKRIALLPSALNRRHVGALRTLFGMVLDELDEQDPRVRGLLDTQLKSLSDAEFPSGTNGEDRSSEQRERDDESTKNDDDKESASSSSSVIFPPSPTPISLSSHSSVHSPKSSHSSRKRKNRHKKNKPSKKMKYVLVKNPEPHPVDAFLAGVAPILKGLNPVFLNLAKSDIITAALKYERRMLTDNCNGSS